MSELLIISILWHFILICSVKIRIFERFIGYRFMAKDIYKSIQRSVGDLLRDENTKTIGSNEKTYKKPDDLVIDGQQRLTSLLAAVKGLKEILSYSEFLEQRRKLMSGIVREAYEYLKR